ncbi:MAG: sulfatase [Verrucomicrobiales bacterium]|nr:sulfatase [Verrucomicrobiales bacterium]
MKRFLLPLFLCLSAAITTAEERLPNIILVLVDDMGWMDVTCQGSDFYRTPNIDRLASEGMRFTNGYAACAVCSPTRAAVQTGRYPHRVGVTDWIRSRFQRGGKGTPEENPTEYVGGKNRKLLCPPNPFWMEHGEETIPEMLDSKNYKSAYIGKWHLGDPAWFPEGQGYDENRGGCDYGQPPSYFDPYNLPKGRHETLREGIFKLPGRKPGEYLTHREGDEAEALIRMWEHTPFFLMIGHYAVHTPIQAIPEVAAKYDTPGEHQKNAKYAAMVESVDDAMGQVLKTLEELEIDDRTMIIFTSDNGGLLGPTSNKPLRSGKGYCYEGGIRVPFLVRWPGVIPAGKVSDAPVQSIDLKPTIEEAVGGIERDATPELDGISLMDHLASGGEIPLERDELIWHFPHYRHAPGPYSIIRKGDYKLIKFWEGIFELYDLKNDLGESQNLADEMPDKVKELDDMLLKRLEEQQAKLPKPNPDFDTATSKGKRKKQGKGKK